jgi:Zn-dependent M28 family amino/carboxypeptidase
VGHEIAEALASFGWDVALQGPYRNVVALPKGRGAGPLTLLGAHYDSVPGCPGADDNASGVAILLECARALGAMRPAPAVGFVAFNAEEDGLLGSRDFVAAGLAALRLEVATMHVLEMCGFRARDEATQRSPLPIALPGMSRGTFIAIVGQGASNRVATAAAAARCPASPHRVAVSTWPGLHRALPDLARSDHAPFWDTAVPAVLWTDTGNFRNPHYHRASDTPDTLDYAFMNGVRELVLHTLASPPGRR